jgi:sulfite oxidase
VAITTLPVKSVKSIITWPADGLLSGLTSIRVTGAAWAGEEEIVGVKVSTDEGRTWQAAALGADFARYAWRRWEFLWQPPAPGDYVLMSRATDSAGRTQPLTTSWNRHGYLWNAIDRVRIQVKL